MGMVSIGDVTRKLLEINQNEAESLRQYLFLRVTPDES